jgi:hypothetical protein
MAPPEQLLIDAVEHPDPAVRAVGFRLDDPYVESVWVGVIGPTSALLLRRLPRLWHQATSAQVDVAELAASLGVSTRADLWKSQIWRTFHRLAQFRLARPVEGGRVGVFAQIPPISDRQLARLPEWTAQAHDRMLGDHLDQLAYQSGVTVGPVSPGPADHISARLDRLQRLPKAAPAPGLGR